MIPGNPLTVLTAAPYNFQLRENKQREGNQHTEQCGLPEKCLASTNSWGWRLSREENTAAVCHCRKGISNKAQMQQDAAPWDLPGAICFKGRLGDIILLSQVSIWDYLVGQK